MNKVGLVLEGGGMRGVYTAGVLDCLMEKLINIPYIIGVSAGACHASGYVSKQIGRGKKVTIDYIDDKRYLSIKNYFKEKSVFGMNFIFNEIPQKLEPYDLEAFNNFKGCFKIVTTDCNTGKAFYIDCKNTSNVFDALRASSSLPMFAPIVKYENKALMDGAVIDSIPVKKALEDGCEKLIVVLTRNKGFIMKPIKNFKPLIKLKYRKYPKYINAILTRYIRYNETLNFIEELEKQKKIFVIRPTKHLDVGRFEKNKNKLEKLYLQGFNDTEYLLKKLKQFLDK